MVALFSLESRKADLWILIPREWRTNQTAFLSDRHTDPLPEKWLKTRVYIWKERGEG